MSKIREIKPRTPEYIEDVPIGKSKKKDNKIYPRLRLEHEYFQEAKKWEVEKEYEVIMKIKMTGLSISKFQNDSEFDIIGFGVKDNKANE